MPTNPYFQHYKSTNEQKLIEDMIIESIQNQGIDVAYIPRTQDNIDYLYNEDPTNVFNTFQHIEMYPAFVEGFDGDEMMSMFGDEFKKNATFIVSRRRFHETFPEFIRPREGDLVFMPITNAVLELTFVDHESPFFEKGKQYVYELKMSAFEFSYENIETGNVEIDDILSNMDSVLDPENETEDYGQNDELETDTIDDTVFDPSNPFGVR